ncbi:hypothetical protein ACS0TY_033690 [Phlomoides rotata]
MAHKHITLLMTLLALSLGFLVSAFEPSPLQDFCVADSTSSARMNGQACKSPASVGADDFSFTGLHIPGNTSNPNGSKVTPVTVAQLPGLNTLGISLALIEGSLQVGFVTSNPGNSHITKTLQKGDVFVFPVGLVHYQRNVGTTNAVAIAALSSQNPGVITISNAVFGSNPAVSSDVLAKAFQVDKSVVEQMQAKF